MTLKKVEAIIRKTRFNEVKEASYRDFSISGTKLNNHAPTGLG